MEHGDTSCIRIESAISVALRSKKMQKSFAAAVNPTTPAKVLANLAGEAPDWILERIAENPGTPAETLSKLATHCCASIRAAVAGNNNTLLDVLLELVQDESSDVRYSIAENHNMPVGILESLRTDENPYVASRAHRTLARLSENNILVGRFSILTKPLNEQRVQWG